MMELGTVRHSMAREGTKKERKRGERNLDEYIQAENKNISSAFHVSSDT